MSSSRDSFAPSAMTAVKVPSQRAATTGAVRSLRSEAPDLDTAARRLSFSDVHAIHRAHGERDPSLGAVSDEDSRRWDDYDYGLDPDDWQDQSLYEDRPLHLDATRSPCSSPDRDPYYADPEDDPGDWQDQELYDEMLCGAASVTACSSPVGYRTASPCSSQGDSLCHSHGGAVSDEDTCFEDDPGDWQDQELYEDAAVSDSDSAPRDDPSCCSYGDPYPDADDYGDNMSDYSGHKSYGDY